MAAAASFLAIQSADAQNVFWTSNGGLDIRTSDFSGSSPTTIFSGSGLLDGTIVDVAATSSHIYWTDKNDTTTGGGIWRANHDGTGAAKFVSNDGSLFSPQFIHIDESSNRLYFSDWNAGLFSVNLSDGTDLTSHGDPGIGSPASNNTGLALRGPSELVSVTAGAGDLNVYSTDLSDSSSSIFGQYAGTSNQTYGLAYHGATDTAYITTFNLGNLMSYNLTTNESSVIETGITQALGVTLNPEQTMLYIVGRSGGNIYTYDLATETLSPFLTGDDVHFGVAVIPEPGTYALLFGLTIGALLIVRRRFLKS